MTLPSLPHTSSILPSTNSGTTVGERKEFLSQAEHNEMLALVGFVQKRTIEKLEARGALAHLRTALPGLFADA